jgi:prolipoprotein diacylglyceryltransferase
MAVTGYQLLVGLGIVAAFIARAVQAPDRRDLDAGQRLALALAAVVGALFGAVLFELPADACGWAWRPAGVPDDVVPLGGRTVLGGMLGAWILVEAAKWHYRIRGPTGDGFALPLALALACGRLGCAAAGCCAGLPYGGWGAWHGRYPVQFIEAGFHAIAALLLVIAARRGWARGRRLAIYLTAYAALRFALEFWRGNPPLWLGLSWYQYLALLLGALAGGTWALRRTDAKTPAVGPAG